MLHLMLVRTNDEFPGLRVPETLLVNAPQILSYWEAHSPAAERLIGTDKDARKLIARFYLITGIAARRWAYFYALQDRKANLAMLATRARQPGKSSSPRCCFQ